MNILVDYIDIKGNSSVISHTMGRLAFAKHLGIAGQRYAPSAQKFLRSISMFFHYSYYLQQDDFNKNRFSLPPEALSDPTEKGQFSNLAGKAIADFLSKRIDGSLYTVNYEAAMRMKGLPITGNRPDLIAYSKTSVFAIEAKGHSGGSGKMSVHKRQAKTGGIPVNFNIACVSYNMFEDLKCNYHDPFNGDVPYDFDTLKALTKKYYKGFMEFFDERYFEWNSVLIGGEYFYEVSLLDKVFESLYPHIGFYLPFSLGIDKLFKPKLILPKCINEFASEGISKETMPFIFENLQNNIYIDNDRIGLSISNPIYNAQIFNNDK